MNVKNKESSLQLCYKSFNTLIVDYDIIINQFIINQVVISALIGALPGIFNVMAVCIIFWLIFAIIGVNFFMGQFQECIDQETNERFSQDVVPNKTICLDLPGGVWVNPRYYLTQSLRKNFST